MRWLLCAAFVCVVPVAGTAQTIHPCDDVTAPVAVSRAKPLTLLFCARPDDEWAYADVAIDNPSTETVIEVASVKPVTLANIEGYVQYTAPLGTLAPGLHTIVMTVTYRDAQGNLYTSDPSTPYTFTVDAKPGRPKVTGVQ